MENKFAANFCRSVAAMASVCLMGCATAASAALQKSQEEFPQSVPEDLKKAAERWTVDLGSVTAVVIPLDEVNTKPGEPVGELHPVLSINPDRSIAPASTAKLVTTLAALDTLGINYHWRTDFYADRRPDAEGRINTLWIRGGGDPTFVVEDFALELHRLAGNGIRHIEGDVVVDRSAFSLPKTDPGAFDGRANRPYNMLPDAAVVNFRNLSFELTPDKENGVVRIVTVPELAGVSVPKTMALKTKGGCGNWKEAIGYKIEETSEGGKKVSFTGALPLSCGPKNFNVISFGENEYIERLFRAFWEEDGRTWKGHVVSGRVPKENVELIHRRLSPSLADTVRLVNKWSNNLIARHIFLALGNAVIEEEENLAKEAEAKTGAPQAKAERDDEHGSLPYRRSLTLEDSRLAIAKWLEKNGIDPALTYIDNGSGLSRKTRTTARSMAHLLALGWKSPAMSDFVASLPVSGVDGTMYRRKVAVRYGHFKTGFLSNVRSIGGYVLAKDGRRYAVFASVHGSKNMPGGIAFLDNVILWVFNRS